jgi:hypothetical protein
MIAIGGVGGSGTRVIAHSLRCMGFFLGNDLNGALDNLSFTLLFKRRDALEASDAEFAKLFGIFSEALHNRPVDECHRDLLRSLCSERERLTTDFLLQRVDNVYRTGQFPENPVLVAWKEPNTHVVLDRLLKCAPSLRYIHVMRNGLDMAFSENQTQARLWGKILTGAPYESGPAYALRYWRAANERTLITGRRMGENFCAVNFDAFCADPVRRIDSLAEFAGVKLDSAAAAAIAADVKMPTTIGRFRRHDMSAFTPADVDFVACCGFPIT